MKREQSVPQGRIMRIRLNKCIKKRQHLYKNVVNQFPEYCRGWRPCTQSLWLQLHSSNVSSFPGQSRPELMFQNCKLMFKKCFHSSFSCDLRCHGDRLASAHVPLIRSISRRLLCQQSPLIGEFSVILHGKHLAHCLALSKR